MLRIKWVTSSCVLALIAGIAIEGAIHCATYGDLPTFGWHVDVISEKVSCGIPDVDHVQYSAVITNFTALPSDVEACRIPSYFQPHVPTELQPDQSHVFPFHLQFAPTKDGEWRTVRPDGNFQCGNDRKERLTIWPLQSFRTQAAVANALSSVPPGSWLRFVGASTYTIGSGHTIASPPFQYNLDWKVVHTSLCELVKEPDRFNGKLVQFRAEVSRDFERSVVLDDSCAANVHLQLLEFFNCLPEQATHELLDLWPDESKHEVSATMIGRFEHVGMGSANVRNRSGFGHIGQWDSQLVLQAISAVDAEPHRSTPSRPQR